MSLVDEKQAAKIGEAIAEAALAKAKLPTHLSPEDREHMIVLRERIEKAVLRVQLLQAQTELAKREHFDAVQVRTAFDGELSKKYSMEDGTNIDAQSGAIQRKPKEGNHA